MVPLGEGETVGMGSVGSVGGSSVGAEVGGAVAKTAKMSVVTSWKKRKTHWRKMYHR